MIANPKRITIDVDGVCADWNGAFRNLICQLHGVEKQPACWPPEEWAWPNTYCTKEEVAACWEFVNNSGGDWWEDLEAIDQVETSGYLIELALQGHDLYFMTARRGAGVKQATESWFAEELNLWPTVLTGLDPLGKYTVSMALDIQIVVDDRPENCYAMCREHGDDWAPEKIFLFNQPWNQTLHPDVPEEFLKQITRIDSLKEVVELCGR